MVADIRTDSTTAPVPKLRSAAGFVLFFLYGTLFAALGALLPALRDDFGLGPTAGGGLVSVFQLGALAAMVYCGVFARRVDGRVTMSILVLVASGAATALALAPSWPAALAAAAFGGLGFGGLMLYLNTAFAAGFGRRGALVLNLFNATFMVGSIVGPLAVGATARHERHVLLAVAVLALLGWPARRLAGPAAVSAPGGRATAYEPARSSLPVLAVFMVAGLLYGAAEIGVGTWATTHLVAVGFSAPLAASLTALFWAGHALGRVSLPNLAPRRAPARLVVTCTVLAAGALALASVPGVAPYAYAVAGILLGPVFPTLLAWLATVTPATQSSRAMMLTALMIGGAGAPVLVGAAIGGSSAGAVPLALSLLTVAGAVAAIVAARVATVHGRLSAALAADPLLATRTTV
ncbi:MFS transporter [Catellatospora tritici]|uniref:MFS transporter n=1 Tax=Catellatospora tritici TaxID=2851566 RepID=UPI001C2CCDB5|nr:MFS transporter [Catellatospora tritici]MBV1849297.1 MFS transporter [Catellatospora tritici]